MNTFTRNNVSQICFTETIITIQKCSGQRIRMSIIIRQRYTMRLRRIANITQNSHINNKTGQKRKIMPITKINNPVCD